MNWLDTMSETDAATATLALSRRVPNYEKEVAALLLQPPNPSRGWSDETRRVAIHGLKHIALLSLRTELPIYNFGVQVIYGRPSPRAGQHHMGRGATPQPCYILRIRETVVADIVRLHSTFHVPSGWCFVRFDDVDEYISTDLSKIARSKLSYLDEKGVYLRANNLYFSKLCWRATKEPVYWSPDAEELLEVQTFLFGHQSPAESLERFHAQTKPHRS